MTISALAGIGNPVIGPLITSTGSPLHPPTQSYSLIPHGNSVIPEVKRRGSLPKNHCHWTGFSTAEIFIADVFFHDCPEEDIETGLSSRREVVPVGPQVHPAFIRITSDDEASRSNVWTAVIPVPFRNREAGQVNSFAYQSIFKDRSSAPRISEGSTLFFQGRFLKCSSNVMRDPLPKGNHKSMQFDEWYRRDLRVFCIPSHDLRIHPSNTAAPTSVETETSSNPTHIFLQIN